MKRLTAAAQLTASTALLAATIAALDQVHIPTHNDPVAIAVNGIRVAATGACWYLLATTLLGAAARAARATTATAVLDRCSLAFTRRALTVALGTGLTFGSLATATPVAAAAGVPPPGPAAAAPAPVMHLLADAAKPGPPDDPAPASAAPAAAPPREEAGPPTDSVPPPSPTPQVRDELTLQPGDHLWGVAERTLAAAWHRPPAAHDVAPYWHTLIETNRGRLADPSNPDLVYPGQVIALPPPPPPPARPTGSAGP